MTTIRQIITDSFREGGIIQIGTSPSAEQQDEGLRKLQSLIKRLFGNEMGSPLETINYGRNGLLQAYSSSYDMSNVLSSYFVPPNSQLVVNAEQAYNVFLNPQPQDGERVSIVDVAQNFASNYFTLNGNGRRIGTETEQTFTANGTNKSWFYRGDLAQWVEVSDLDLDDESPFPSEFDDYLSISLAMRLNPRYQQQTAPETLMEYKRIRSQFRSKYRQTKDAYPDIALVRLNSRYPDGSGYSSQWGDYSFTYGDVILDGGGPWS